MKSPTRYFQQAIYSTLTSDTDLMALIRGVYDWPDGKTFPVVTIGDDRHAQADCKSEGGMHVMADIHTWTKSGRAKGWKTAKVIADRITELLTGTTLTLDSDSSYVTIGGVGRLESQTNTAEDNGTIRHIVQTFEYFLEEVT